VISVSVVAPAQLFFLVGRTPETVGLFWCTWKDGADGSENG